MFWKTSSSLEIRRDQVSGAIPSRPFPASTHVGVCTHALCSAHDEPSQVFTWWPKSSQVPVQGASPLCPHPLPPCTSVALSMRLCRFGTWCWGGGWGRARVGMDPNLRAPQCGAGNQKQHPTRSSLAQGSLCRWIWSRHAQRRLGGCTLARLEQRPRE